MAGKVTALGGPSVSGAPEKYRDFDYLHIGEIGDAQYHADVVDADRLRVDPAKLDAIARMGGSTCATTRDRFEMQTPKLDAWLATKTAWRPT